jgi:hypothetical protein
VPAELRAAAAPYDWVSAAGRGTSASSPAATPDDVLQTALTHDQVVLAELLALGPESAAPAATAIHEAWAPPAAMAVGRDPQ